MLVYRVCLEEEIKKIFETKNYEVVGTLGAEFNKNEEEVNLNTHVYDKDELYMHFFPEFKNLGYLNLEAGMYICSYDIPEEILNSSKGMGQYANPFTYTVLDELVEYAIKSKDIKFEYLEAVDLIVNNIENLDFLFGEDNPYNYRRIYTKEKANHKTM